MVLAGDLTSVRWFGDVFPAGRLIVVGDVVEGSISILSDLAPGENRLRWPVVYCWETNQTVGAGFDRLCRF